MMKVYCERCRHEHKDAASACCAPTVKGKDCLCPRLVKPTGGPLASFSQHLKKEAHRSGKTLVEDVKAQ